MHLLHLAQEFNYVSASRETNHPAVHRLGSARRRSGDVSESQLPHDVPNAALGDADPIPGTVFNSVAGNMTQLNVTSYQTSGWCSPIFLDIFNQ
jgi:hypothetical protein